MEFLMASNIVKKQVRRLKKYKIIEVKRNWFTVTLLIKVRNNINKYHKYSTHSVWHTTSKCLYGSLQTDHGMPLMPLYNSDTTGQEYSSWATQ